MQQFIVIRCFLRNLENRLNEAVRDNPSYEVFDVLLEHEYNGSFAHIILKRKDGVA